MIEKIRNKSSVDQFGIVALVVAALFFATAIWFAAAFGTFPWASFTFAVAVCAFFAGLVLREDFDKYDTQEREAVLNN